MVNTAPTPQIRTSTAPYLIKRETKMYTASPTTPAELSRVAPLLTEREAAALMRVDRRTLRRLVEAGRLRAINVGSGKRRHYRFTQQAIFDIALQSTASQTAAASSVRRIPRFRARRSDQTDACLPSA